MRTPVAQRGDEKLVGRAIERAMLSELIDASRGGTSSALVLRGEPGIGKTALLEYAVEQAADIHVLRARGVESESELPFAGLLELLRPALDQLERLPRPQAAALAGALALGPPVPGDPFTVSAATLSLLAAKAQDGPLLAVVDDLYWVDASSQQALVFAARRLGAEGVVLLFAIREGVPSSLDNSEVRELRLSGLEEIAARELICRATPEVSAEVTTAILGTARGNPLALLEIPLLLDEAQLRGRAPIPNPLPTGEVIEHAFAERLAAVSAPARDALLVAATTETDDGDVVFDAARRLGLADTVFDECEEGGLITIQEGRVVFRHPLVRSVAYHGASPKQRRRAHRALAEVLSGARQAWHLALAAAGQDEEIAALLESTALDARARSSYAAAATAWERSARLTPDPRARARRLVAAARDAQLAGRVDSSIALLDSALTLASDALVRAEIQHLRGRGEMLAGLLVDAHAHMSEAARLIEQSAPNQAAMILAEASFPAIAMADVKRARETAEGAFALAQHEQDPQALFLSSVALCQAIFLAGQAQQARVLLDHSLPAIAEADPLGAHQLMQGPALGLIYMERFEEARALLARIITAARDRSAPAVLPLAAGALAELRFRTGDWAGLAGASAEAAQLAQDTGQEAALRYILAASARLDAAQGRAGESRAKVARVLEGAGDVATAMMHYAGTALGFLEFTEGRYESVTLHLEPLAHDARTRGIRNPTFVQGQPLLIEAQARVGRVTEARRELGELEAEAMAMELNWPRAAAARCRGLLAADSEFEEPFAESLSWHDKVTMPFERAWTELCLGERRRRARRRADAREPLRAALAMFEHLGAVPWADRARHELRATGETVRRGEAHLTDELTPHELHVALVVARGATNKEAAAELFLSPKTVDFHLQHIYSKLGVRSRTELARLLARGNGSDGG